MGKVAKKTRQSEGVKPSDIIEEGFRLSDHIEGIENLSPEQALNKLVRGMAAMHRSMKEYRRSNDDRLAEINERIEGLTRRLR